jgi:hypothetical protein
MISTKLKQSKNRIFLLEITINLLLFSALLIVGLLFFIKTHKLTEETQVLHGKKENNWLTTLSKCIAVVIMTLFLVK